MKKYKNVKAIKARKCYAYQTLIDKDGFLRSKCIGVSEPFSNPNCKGYKCKCTQYKYDSKRGKLI